MSGKWRQIKWATLVVLLGLYYVVPWLRWDRGPDAPNQAILIDLDGRRGWFFDVVIWPQEIYFVTGFLILGAFGLFFFLFSLPFFVLSWYRLGPAFTFKSFGAVALVSACTTLAPKVVRFELLNPWVASVLGGFLIGFGLLALLRHQASVGGVNIVAQWLQQTRGLRAGYIQMSVDVLVVLTAFAVVPPERVLQSVVGAVAIGAILTLNHRPGRYLGV